MKNVFIFLLMLSASVLGAPKATKCIVGGITYNDGDPIPNGDPCMDCYCSIGGIDDQICAASDCGIPPPFLNCTQLPTPEDQCCPEFDCPDQWISDCLKKLEIYFIACFKPVFETFLIANQIVRLNIMPHIQFVIWKRWRQFQFCCLFWYRHRLPKSLRNLLLIGQMCHALKTKLNTNPERICHPMIHADLAYAGLEENIVPNQIVKALKGLILQCNQKMSFEIEIFCWFSNTVSGLNYRCHTSSSWHEVRTLSFRSGWHQKYFAILGHDAIYCCEIILH